VGATGIEEEMKTTEERNMYIYMEYTQYFNKEESTTTIFMWVV
jgi:hypothetical protein